MSVLSEQNFDLFNDSISTIYRQDNSENHSRDQSFVSCSIIRLHIDLPDREARNLYPSREAHPSSEVLGDATWSRSHLALLFR